MRETIVDQARDRLRFFELAIDLHTESDPRKRTPHERFLELRQRIQRFVAVDPDTAPHDAATPGVEADRVDSGGELDQLSLRFRLLYGIDRISQPPAVNTLTADISPLPRQPRWQPIAAYAEWLLHPVGSDPAQITRPPHTRGEMLSYGGILKTTGVLLAGVADPSIPGPALPGVEADLSYLERTMAFYEQAQPAPGQT